MGSGVVVSGLALTPVKATRLHTVERIELGPDGARGNRRFFMVDERDRMLNGKVLGELTRVLADFNVDAQLLRMTFPDGRVAEGRVALGEVVSAKFFSRSIQTQLVDGPWSEALTEDQGPVACARAEPRRRARPPSPPWICCEATATISTRPSHCRSASMARW